MAFEIIEGDILENLDRLEDKRFRLVFTSPPYNIGKSYEKRISLSAYLEWQEAVIAALVPKVADNGSIAWQTGNHVEKGEITPLDIPLYPIFKKLGLKLRNRLIWHFGHGLHCQKRFSGRYETILWLTKSDDYVFNLDAVRAPSKYPGKLHYKGPKKGQPSGNPLGKNPSDFWIFDYMADEFGLGIIDAPNVKNNHPEKTAHPCQFPVELAERFVLACSNPDDWVFDPFGGAGTTLIAALKNGRNAAMCEINPQYAQIAKDRIQKLLSGKLITRPIGKKIPAPSGKAAKKPDEWVSSGT